MFGRQFTKLLEEENNSAGDFWLHLNLSIFEFAPSLFKSLIVWRH